MDSYLLFWDNHIVEVKFNWQPSTEQIARLPRSCACNKIVSHPKCTPKVRDSWWKQRVVFANM